MERIRALVIDDSEMVRGRVEALLEHTGSVEVLKGVGTKREAVEAIHAEKPDLIILDLSLPDGNGLDLISDIKAERPKAVVIVFTNFSIRVLRERCLQLGADHFLDKSSDFECIPDMVTQLAKKRRRQ